jgi:hypothetical protein
VQHQSDSLILDLHHLAKAGIQLRWRQVVLGYSEWIIPFPSKLVEEAFTMVLERLYLPCEPGHDEIEAV